jgi:hypothetical protein
MVGKCQLEVRITHPEQGREQAIDTLLYCLEDQRFWDILEPALQEAFRHSVQEVTGKAHQYDLMVKEHDLLRHIREKAERYAQEA